MSNENKEQSNEQNLKETDQAGNSASGAQGQASEALETPAVPEPLNLAQIEELKAKAHKADEHWDKYVRTVADFENFKKRAARERQDAIKYANEALMEKLVPILDTFDMALAAAGKKETASVENLKTGITMVASQLRSILAEAGLEEIDAQGQPFDPNVHEAVSQQETDEVPEGHVVQQMRKGFKLRGRLLRPASVVVAKKPEAK